MTRRKPSKTFVVHVLRTVTSRLAVQAQAESAVQAKHLVQRELSQGRFLPAESDWGEVTQEFTAQLVHLAAMPVTVLQGFDESGLAETLAETSLGDGSC